MKMSGLSSRHGLGLLLATSLLVGPGFGFAAEAAKAGAEAKGEQKSEVKADKAEKGILPAAVSKTFTQTVGGKPLSYKMTATPMAVKNAKGEKIGEVLVTSYVVEGARPDSRPVTFAFNGGPGASSVYLHLGVLGPKTLPYGNDGDGPSTAAQLQDNPDTWLGFTDIVFVDPIGTGFSRPDPKLTPEEVKKNFYGVDQDVSYLSRVIYDWLVANGRLTAQKYLVGESYGGYRGPKIARKLQVETGVGVSGVILLSPLLDWGYRFGPEISPLGWMGTLPSMAAAKLERDKKPLSRDALKDAEAYASGEFPADFFKGIRDQAAVDRMSAKVSALTGLDAKMVREKGGRLDNDSVLRGAHRAEGKISSGYDTEVNGYDPYPFSQDRRASDPSLDSLIAPATSAVVDLYTRQLGYKVDGPYNALSYEVNRAWEYDNRGLAGPVGALDDLRRAMSVDPRLKVLIAHGYTDLVTPYFASQLAIDQVPVFNDAKRLQLKVYPGGHMFYSRPTSRAAFKQAAEQVYRGQ